MSVPSPIFSPDGRKLAFTSEHVIAPLAEGSLRESVGDLRIEGLNGRFRVLGQTGAIAKAIAVEPGLNIAGFHRGRWPAEAAAVGEAVQASGRKIAFIEAEAGTAEAAEQGARRSWSKLARGASGWSCTRSPTPRWGT